MDDRDRSRPRISFAFAAKRLSLRTRLVGAVALLTVLTLGGAFASVSIAVNRAQEKQLDQALLHEAHEEAREIARHGGSQLTISDRPGPAANDVGPLTKYAAIYDHEGHVLTATATFEGRVPALGAVAGHDETPFDLDAREKLRAVTVSVPDHPQLHLLLGAPRSDLDGDASFLGRAMLMAFGTALVWSIAIASWFVRRLTREYESVADTVRRVADGDLEARVAVPGGGTMLAHDMDEVLSRLRTLVSAQQRFVANAAHEIRTPLTALYGEVTFVLRRERNAGEYRSALEEVLDATGRLNTLAEELLTLARLGVSTDVPRDCVALDEIARSVVNECRILGAARSVQFDTELQSVMVLGRRSELERVVRNLVENALAHTPDGGRVRIRVVPDQGEAQLTVVDEGPGVSDQDRDRIFEPFFRGKAERITERGGVGLGLAIVREIVRSHRGTITLASQHSGEGARLVVGIPLAQSTG